MRDKQSTGRSEIAALAERVANARDRLPLQDDAALVQALSDAEIDAERELAQWVRAQRRGQRKRAVQDEIAAEKRSRRTVVAIQRADDADARWHRRALAARRRVSNQDARLAQLYRRAEWSSRALIAVVVLGMVWAGVNVQHNLVPSGNMADPLYWLSYGIEAMISIPIITIMVAATTAARWGRELDRGKVVLFEAALLGTTVALNAGPHLAAGSFGQAAEYAIAPVMVGVVIWLHAWVSARYAMLIDGVPLIEDEPDLPPRQRVTTERGAAVDTFRADDATDRRELLAAKGFDPLLDQAGVRFPVDTDTHIAETSMRAAQPAVSRLDCTETLVYHAQSTRSTNGRPTRKIPNDDYHPGRTVHTSDPIHNTARAVTDPTLPAHNSAANTLGEHAFHTADLDHHTTANVGGRTPHTTTHMAAPTAAMSTRIGHTIAATNGFAPDTARFEPQTASATDANEHTASDTSGVAVRTAPAATDRTAFPAAGDDLRTAAAADPGASDQRVGSDFESDATTLASARSARTTSVVGEAESRTTAAQSQLSIFDAASVEAGYDTVDATADRAKADTSRATASRTASTTDTGADASNPANSSPGTETHTHTSAPAGAPAPAKSSTRADNSTRTSTPGDASHLAKSATYLETATRTSEPAGSRPINRGSATPAERITRATDGLPTSRMDDSATDHEDQTADAEVRQLVSDDAPSHTTSEVISEVVQSLSAENLLTENVGSGSDDIEVWSVARAIAGRGLSVIPVEQLAEILMLADQSWTPTSIGAEVGLSRTAIAQVLEFARRVRRPYAISS